MLSGTVFRIKKSDSAKEKEKKKQWLHKMVIGAFLPPSRFNSHNLSGKVESNANSHQRCAIKDRLAAGLTFRN